MDFTQGCLSGRPLPRADGPVRNGKTTQYDFYFSQKQAEQFVEMSNADYTLKGRIKKYRFRDKPFTRRVAKGIPLPKNLTIMFGLRQGQSRK